MGISILPIFFSLLKGDLLSVEGDVGVSAAAVESVASPVIVVASISVDMVRVRGLTGIQSEGEIGLCRQLLHLKFFT